MYVPSHKIMILLLRWQVAMERTFCTVSWETSLSGSPYGSGTPLSLMQCSWRDPRDLFVQGAHHVLNLLRHLLIHVLISLKDICLYVTVSFTLSMTFVYKCPHLAQVICLLHLNSLKSVIHVYNSTSSHFTFACIINVLNFFMYMYITYWDQTIWVST